MKKKILLMLTAIFFVLCALGFASCGGGEETPVVSGNYIYFGSYPQSEVTDSATLANLTWRDAQTTALPTSSNANGWTDYGYYISGGVSSYMWYKDVSYNGEEYRAVYFTSYRPEETTSYSSTDNSWQNGNGYYISTVYWFKFETIEWRILSQNGNEYFVMANVILDSQEYYPSTASRTINGSTVYANNYAYSTIRSWLNEDFYNTAFTAYEKTLIQLVTVDNSASTTDSSTNAYACENTQDYIFLLSYQDAINSSYGFSSSYRECDTTRLLKPTAYACSQGQARWKSTSSSYPNNGYWWLRSPDSDNSRYARFVMYKGYVSGDNVDVTCVGVVPALLIRL